MNKILSHGDERAVEIKEIKESKENKEMKESKEVLSTSTLKHLNTRPKPRARSSIISLHYNITALQHHKNHNINK
jgi:hypothetical protein